MKTVTAAILVHEGKILIGRRGAGDKLAGCWEFPGGTVEEHETPEDCLVREMREEFAIGITVDSYVGESVYHYDHGSIRLMAFLSHWKEGRLNCLIHDQYAWVDIPDLIHYNFSPADVPFVQRILIGDIMLK